MKEKSYNFFHFILPAFLMLIVLSVLGYNFSLLSSGSAYFDDQANSIVQRYAMQTASSIQRETDDAFTSIRTVAAQLPTVRGYEQIDAFGERMVEQYQFNCLQFLEDGEANYRYGKSVGSASAAQVTDLIEAGQFGVSSLYDDPSLGVPCVAVYCPVSNNPDIDGVLAYCAILNLFTGADNVDEFTRYYFLVEENGNIIESSHTEGMKTDVSHNAITYLKNITENKTEVDPIIQRFSNKVGGCDTIHIDGEKYIVSTIPASRFSSQCFILQIYSANEILHNEYALYDRMMGTFVVLALITVASLLICVIIKRKDDRILIAEMETDPLLGCSSYNKFIYDATDILEHNRYSKYAVVYFDINKFHYIKKHLGTDGAEATLKFVSNVIKRMVDQNETYGHAFDDYFVVLMHYSSENELGERIKLLAALISNFHLLRSKDMEAMIAVGVYPVQPDKRLTVQEMIDYAKMALQANRRLTEQPYVIYNPSIAASYIEEAAIESKMRASLKNHDFKLFFQPKYGIENDRLDSAEVLVRWYDTERQSYIAPDSFIGVFEANGFVAELDHYVFEEVCRFLNEYTGSGEKVVPLSVNVSRATAIRPDFVRFYVEKKKEYKIADNFITLEFTESFANESYELLEQLLTSLKNSGFRCSIDDFGMGHSSLIALKELPFDELKLDRALLKTGTNEGKDNAVLKMLINMGKDMGMVMTQEGVETLEDMNRMIALDCDLIQGYYYSKPLPQTQFVDFMNDDTSLNAIKRFKKQDTYRLQGATR